MKITLTLILSFLSIFCSAQIKLETKDLTNLVSISEIYSANVNATGDEFTKSIELLRTPELSHIVDVLLELGKGRKEILAHLKRPDNDELMMWYVLREIHYNNSGKTKTDKASLTIANEILNTKIDEKLLLDNYYYRLHSGIAMLFNNHDLSDVNIDIESYGLKNNAEKGIFFLSIVDELIGKRFRVLSMLKNNAKILEFYSKMPTFNNKPYFYYKDFDYDDFEWTGYDKLEHYNIVHINNLYNTLMAQFVATTQLKGKDEGQKVYYNSILYMPQYFKYTAAKDDLEKVYEKLKKN